MWPFEHKEIFLVSHKAALQPVFSIKSKTLWGLKVGFCCHFDLTHSFLLSTKTSICCSSGPLSLQVCPPTSPGPHCASVSDKDSGGSIYLISSSSSFAAMQRPIAPTSDMKAARRCDGFALFVDRWARCFCLVHIVQKNNIFQVSHEEVGEMETWSFLTPRFTSRTDVCGPSSSSGTAGGATHPAKPPQRLSINTSQQGCRYTAGWTDKVGHSSKTTSRSTTSSSSYGANKSWYYTIHFRVQYCLSLDNISQ